MTTAARTNSEPRPRYEHPQTPQAREAFLSTFTDPLLKALGWIQNWNKDEARFSLKSRYDLGKFVKTIYDKTIADAGGGIYGLHAVEKLAAALGEDRSLLDTTRRFVEAYDEMQLIELCALTRHDGSTLQWSHVRALLAVPDVAAREKLQQRCVQKCWTSDELRKVIKDERESPTHDRTGKGGPKMKMPATPSGHAEKVNSLAGTEAKRVEMLVANASIAEMVRNMTPETASPALMEAMLDAQVSIDKEIAALQKLRNDYATGLIYIQRLIQKQAETDQEERDQAADDDDAPPPYEDASNSEDPVLAEELALAER